MSDARYWLMVMVSCLPATAAAVDFEREIAPLLAKRCLSCHAGDASKGQLDLTRRESALRGGESGPAIVPKSLKDSPLWQRVEADEMPPKNPLPNREKKLLSAWIERGAAWPDGALDPLRYSSEERAGYDWWSLQPLTRPQPERVAAASSVDGEETAATRPRSAIDVFIDEQLAAARLAPNGPAERRVLMRRLWFDLLGLPPSPEEIDEFVRDERSDAYERLVDRCLASPHYGERWARHWLDVVRFGESNGFERDLPRPNAWHYRDWVIAAFNADMPYDEFVRWQLAGDVIAPNEPAAAAALGFLVAGPHDTVVPVVERMRQQMRQDELEDVVGVVGQTFLGLTVNCARCHDHKFDPISTKEYYQLAAALSGIDHGERDIVPPAVAGQLREWGEQIAALEAVVYADDFAREVRATELEQLQRQRAALSKTGPVKMYTPSMTQPGAGRILKRGNVSDVGDVVTPAGLAAIASLSPEFGLKPDALEHHRRIKLAEWITDRRNPLFARVMVNRLWHYHFGAGLVESPNDFGFHAGQPSHPELLDWLACELVDSGYSLMHLHRLIVTSATYRQASTFRADAAKVDANNRLLWRMSPRRLDAECVRDAMLSAAGELNDALGGKSYSDFNSYFFKGTQFYDPIDAVSYDSQRRTVYRMWARGGRSPFLDTFDCPDPSTTTPRRSSTTTPLQALSLMNNAFVLRMANRLAERVKDDVGTDTERGVVRAYELLFSRRPTPEETQFAKQFVERRGLAAACRGLMNASEFLYVD